MTEAARFSDWSSLPQGERLAAADRCRKRLSIIGRKLNAVAGEFSASMTSGPLAGFPYVAKDMIATGRAAPSWGCAQPVSSDAAVAPVIQRLDKAGAVLIGAAEMTELAYEPSGMNAARGAVRNPWNFDCVPGGSSSGSAALVAAGCCFAALGSDTGGSVRIPAHCCGVTALKPTYGAIPSEGTMPLAPSLDTIGILARSAADLSMIWPVLSGAQATHAAVPIKATVLTDAFAEASTEIAEICRAALEALAACGVSPTDAGGFPEASDRNALIVMQAEAARSHRRVIDDTTMPPVLRKRLAKGLTIDDDTLAVALAQRNALRDGFVTRYLSGGAVAILPVMPIATPEVKAVDPSSPQFDARTLYAMSRFTRFVNYLGLPALALPAGFDARGMPVGLQIVGAPNSDASLLALAAKFQQRTDWHGRIPTAIRDDIAAERELAA